jgi:hypothetical protein
MSTAMSQLKKNLVKRNNYSSSNYQLITLNLFCFGICSLQIDTSDLKPSLSEVEFWLNYFICFAGDQY